MIIPQDAKMMLFRFSNYKKHAFIDEHIKVINDTGYVWMMKVGKRTSLEKINSVLDSGGFLVLKAPVKNGGNYYICHFTEIKENEISELNHVPSYYKDYINDGDFCDRYFQLFKVKWIVPLPDEYADSLALQLNGNPVSETIKETRTAVMFIYNKRSITINERE